MENVNTSKMGVNTQTNFNMIDPKEGSKSFPTLVSRPQGRKMKASISLEKYRIKLKWEGRRIIIPINPKEGKPWLDPCDEEGDIQNWY